MSNWLRRPISGRQADRDLPALLERQLADIASVLHDVRLPGCRHRLDHLVVAPSGIWLIDTVHLSGRIARRDLGSRHEPDFRLLLDGIDRTAVLDELRILRNARQAIRAMQLGIDVQTATCVIDATWALSARPFQVNGHWVTWPRALTDKIGSSGLIPIRTAREVAATIEAVHTGLAADADASPQMRVATLAT